MRRRLPLALLAMACAAPAWAQFQLIQVNGAAQQPVGAVFDFGAVDPAGAVTAAFGLQNVGAGAVSLTALTLAGTGFTLSAPPLPASVDPQATLKFSVSFRAAAAGSYSATFQGGGVSVLFLATVKPGLTYEIIQAAGAQPLSGPADFRTVTLGSSATLNFAVLNQTSAPLTVPAILVSGADFSLGGPPLSGRVLQPLDSGGFSVVFTPAQAGARAGTLSIGGSSYALLGTGQTPPLPHASLSINLPQAASGQQGAAGVSFDSAPFTAASGSITMSFAPAAGIPASAVDSAIAFASGGQTVSFTVPAGSRTGAFAGQIAAAFATGTTAGTLTFTLQFGGASTQQTVIIAPAAVGFASLQASRQTGSVTVQVSGFDNTRTVGKLTFTFYDSSGNPIQPGAITADAGSDFAKYFQTSTLGGVFGLSAVFPVTGSAAGVSAVEMSIANSAGIVSSGRLAF